MKGTRALREWLILGVNRKCINDPGASVVAKSKEVLKTKRKRKPTPHLWGMLKGIVAKGRSSQRSKPGKF